MMSELRLIRWNRAVPPADLALRHTLQTEGLSVMEWTDPPGTIYPAHTHPFVQVHVILSGHLRVGLPETAEEIIMGPGDRLDVPTDLPHWEDVTGSQLVTYFVASRSERDDPDLDGSLTKASEHNK